MARPSNEKADRYALAAARANLAFDARDVRRSLHEFWAAYLQVNGPQPLTRSQLTLLQVLQTLNKGLEDIERNIHSQVEEPEAAQDVLTSECA